MPKIETTVTKLKTEMQRVEDQTLARHLMQAKFHSGRWSYGDTARRIREGTFDEKDSRNVSFKDVEPRPCQLRRVEKTNKRTRVQPKTVRRRGDNVR